MTRPTCVDLRSLFGHLYKIRHEESYWAERPEFRKEEEPWLLIIQCVHGHIYPHGDDLLAWSSSGRGPIVNKVCRLPYVEVVQDGDDGVNATFPLAHFQEVAEIVKPKKRPPKRVLTPEQRQAAIERLAPYQFATQIKRDYGGLERVQTGLDDSQVTEGHQDAS
jgi:hypothetical protein